MGFPAGEAWQERKAVCSHTGRLRENEKGPPGHRKVRGGRRARLLGGSMDGRVQLGGEDDFEPLQDRGDRKAKRACAARRVEWELLVVLDIQAERAFALFSAPVQICQCAVGFVPQVAWRMLWGW